MDENIYLVKDENQAINNWLNVEQIHAKLRKSSYSSTDMKDYLNANTPFGGKMIQALAQMKVKFQLDQQEVLEIYYYMASTGAQESKYELRHNDSEYVFMLTFTQMDVILELTEGDHYFIIPARQGLIFKANLHLRIVENPTDAQHRFVIVELARRSQLEDV